MSEKASIGKVSRVNIAMIHTYINKIIAYLNFGTEIDEENFGDSLVCKKCGHKQRNDETILELRKRFSDTETHDIPYYCGACMDNAGNEEYNLMQKEMRV